MSHIWCLKGPHHFVSGGREVTINEPLYAHDFIEISARTPSRIYEECAPLYEKSTVRETLKKNEMALRNPLNGNAIHLDRLHIPAALLAFLAQEIFELHEKKLVSRGLLER